MTSYKLNEKKKWTKEDIVTLIEAYKEEPCLYVVNSPNYRNKHARSEALKRVCAAVSVVRPGSMESECTTKFHSLRNQFNIENAKVKSSMKSGTGTNDVYKPNLWYFDHLKYLETYFMPRKSRNSIEKNFTEEPLTSNQDEELSKTQQLSQMNIHEEFLAEEWLENTYLNSTGESTAESASFLTRPSEVLVTSVNNQFSPINSRTTTSITPDRTFFSRNISRPHPSISPANSTTSSSGVSTGTHYLPPLVKTTKKRKSNTEDVYAGAIEALADSLKQPIIVKLTDASTNNSPNNAFDPVDACMTFVGSILKRFKNEKFKFETMNALVQIVINASTQGLEEERHN